MNIPVLDSDEMIARILIRSGFFVLLSTLNTASTASADAFCDKATRGPGYSRLPQTASERQIVQDAIQALKDPSRSTLDELAVALYPLLAYGEETSLNALMKKCGLPATLSWVADSETTLRASLRDSSIQIALKLLDSGEAWVKSRSPGTDPARLIQAGMDPARLRLIKAFEQYYQGGGL